MGGGRLNTLRLESRGFVGLGVVGATVPGLRSQFVHLPSGQSPSIPVRDMNCRSIFIARCKAMIDGVFLLGLEIPDSLRKLEPTVKEMRDAFEHIDERAQEKINLSCVV